MAKTPTPAQLAARERFAAMARAGAFKKRRKNPDYPVRSVEGQKNLAYRGSRIASLMAMNEQIRKLDPTEAWHPDNITDSNDLDGLQDSISETLVRLQREKAPAGYFANPMSEADGMSVDAHGIVGVSPDVTVELEDTRHGQRRSFTSEFFVDRDSIDPGWFVWGRWGGVGRGVGVVKRVAWPAGPMRKWPKITRLVQPGFRTKADAQLVADQLAAEFIRRANPLTRVKVKSPSMATGAPPSKRLTKRRKATAKAPAGYYANPITPAMPWGVFRGEVQIAAFRSEAKAKEYGQAYADAHRMPVGVKRIK